jgi:phenylalanyl-tRNA synthetase beta chain
VRSTYEVEALDRVRDALVARGMFEAVTWPMTDPGRVAAFAADDRAIRLKNPLGEERSVMRRSLLAGLLDSLGHNLARGEESVALFELGRVYPPAEEGAPIPDENPEPLMLGVVWCGVVDEHWSGTGRPVDGHDLVGAATSALAAAGVSLRAVASRSGPPSWSHPAVSAALAAGRRQVGWVGRLHPDILDRWQIEVPVFALELELSGLISPEAPVPSYRSIGRTPASWRDAALLVDASTPWAAVQTALDGFSNTLLESVRLFDVYEGGALPDGKKSLAIRAVYRDPSGTLTDEVVDKVHGKLLRHLEHRAGAVLRTA